MVPCTFQAAAAAIGEARDIADNLRCQPLLDRYGSRTSPCELGEGAWRS